MLRGLCLFLLCGFVLTACHAHGDHAPPQAAGQVVEVPPGHMPPPGSCRIWRPGLPPGLQDPPGLCYQLRYRLPRGAYLIRG